MNKRQYKKSRKKINKLIFLDEFFMIDYTKEEHKAFCKDVEDYCYKHHRYKHYKDKNKYGIWDCNYKPPLANKRKAIFDNLDKVSIEFNANTGKDTILKYLSENY